jgi:hypothetical protein
MSGSAVANEALLAGVAKVLGLPSSAALGELRPSTLWNRTQRELLEAARLLGVVKVSRLNKEALLARVWEALDEAGAFGANGAAAVAGEHASNGTPVSEEAPLAGVAASLEAATLRMEEDPDETPPAAAHKFEVGGRAPQVNVVDLKRLRAEAEAHIPWSYDRDRVTAMPVNPERLYVYGEVTDASIAKARAGLGPAGNDAWLALRVYDVTGRIFDGTNAHGYFDHNLDRSDRQWFFEVGKPTSQAVVDVGMKSREGFFVKIARSGRVEFPPRGPAGWTEPEWMSVRLSTGETSSGYGPPPVPPAFSPPSGGGGGGGGGAGGGGGGAWMGGELGGEATEVRRRMWEERVPLADGGYEERVTWEEMSTSELPSYHESWSWEGDSEITSWNAGPFTYPVEAPPITRESFTGPSRVFRNGAKTHVVWGPWQLVIRGLGAHAEHKVVARWEVFRAWTNTGWKEIAGTDAIMPGSSELRAGASERWGRAGSELRLGGASERFLVGASELRLGGASERVFVGSTELSMRGASERRWAGGSEYRLGGASERLIGGASERRLGGASERLGGGASERRLGGASERLGGGSELRLAPPPGGGEPPDPAGVVWPSLGGLASK